MRGPDQSLTLPPDGTPGRSVFVHVVDGQGCSVWSESDDGPRPVAVVYPSEVSEFAFCKECRTWGKCDEHGDPTHEGEQLIRCVLES